MQCTHLYYRHQLLLPLLMITAARIPLNWDEETDKYEMVQNVNVKYEMDSTSNS